MICVICGKEFKSWTSIQKTCSDECRFVLRRNNTYASRKRHGKQVGVGSGNAQGRGKEHHSYKNGTGSDLVEARATIVALRKYCERCGIDLTNPFEHWCLHHRDYNPEHNEWSNFELLCKSCHQKEHTRRDSTGRYSPVRDESCG